MKQILLTGFTYFLNYYYNPAEEVVEKLDGSVIKGYFVIGLKLPVSNKRAPKMLKNYLTKHSPDIVIGIGLAPTTNMVVLELVTTNIIHHEKPDIDGETSFTQFIDREPFKVIATRLPFREIMMKCRRIKQYPIRVGVSIGTYLCNHIGYLIMDYCWKNDKIGGFLHIPPHTRLGLRNRLPNYLSLDIIIDTVKCVIETSIETIGNK